jgi:DNA-binding winged helix-turn-helix (wHTH) protein
MSKSRKPSSSAKTSKPTRKTAAPARAIRMARASKDGAKDGSKDASKDEGDDASEVPSALQNWLQLGQLRAEKCELNEAKVAFEMALRLAKRKHDLKTMMEAISGLLRLAGESLDEEEIQHWDEELDLLMQTYPKQVPAMAWYCKGAVARHKNRPFDAQRFFHRYLRALGAPTPRRNGVPGVSHELGLAQAKGWIMLATMLWHRGRYRRATFLAEELLKRFEARNYKGINGFLYLILGNVEEKARRIDQAKQWYQKAHATFLGEHNWYYHLYVLYGYARLARIQRNYPEAYWHLNLMEKAASGREFGLLKREIQLERGRLESDAVDLLVDSRQCLVKTREQTGISLGKQYVLLHILEALTRAHEKDGADMERGLSKAEIIQRVWKEDYRPEAHDNKLYYNINRLRKLIEPDVKNPQYLLNWKEGYRLAPGLRVQFIGNRVENSLRGE